MKELFQKYKEVISYLFFGGLTTLVNIALYTLLARLTPLPTAAANGIALVCAILFAYVTNRIWVFESRTSGKAALKEFLSFIACRAGTGVLDEVIMIAGVDMLGLWDLGVKVAANVIVIIANYVFSKLLIFRKGK